MGNKNPNGFGKTTTAEEVSKDISLEGKTVIVTGSNTGIGKETARVLALRGANIIMACRNTKKMEVAIKELQEKNSTLKLQGIPLDLGDSKSIDDFVAQFEKMKLPLHILINNAGVMAVPKRWTTKDGFEYQIGINHFGHFRLTMKLLPIMVKTVKEENLDEARIVNVSSFAHTFGTKKINYEDLHWEKSYDAWGSYAQSKLSNILFSKELNRKLQNLKIPISVFSLHPGTIHTELGRDMNYSSLFYTLGGAFMKSIPQGAATSVYAAIHPEIKGNGGLYFSDCYVAKPIPFAEDENEQKKFFERSEKETGVEFPKFEE
eukprot:gene11336-4504_t